MNIKQIIQISVVLCMLAMPALAATGTATSPKDIIGDPIKGYHQYFYVHVR